MIKRGRNGPDFQAIQNDTREKGKSFGEDVWDSRKRGEIHGVRPQAAGGQSAYDEVSGQS